MCSCHSILECYVTFSGVKLSIRSFVLFLTMKELTALQDKDKEKGLGLGKYNSAAQSVTPSYIYMVVKLSLSLCLGLFSFDNHIIIQLAFFIS